MTKESEKEKIVLESRQSIYNYPKRIYKMWGYELPINITFKEVGYLAVAEVVMLVINWAFRIPLLFGNLITDIVIKFGLIPYFATRVVKYSRLDGKSPFAFVRDYISFFFDRKKKYFMFRDVTSVPEHKEYVVDWWCSSRHRLRLRAVTRKSRRLR